VLAATRQRSAPSTSRRATARTHVFSIHLRAQNGKNARPPKIVGMPSFLERTARSTSRIGPDFFVSNRVWRITKNANLWKKPKNRAGPNRLHPVKNAA
jgi:hypothetical protein